MSSIPALYHYCYFGGRALGWLEYIAVSSAIRVNRPDTVFFHCDVEPQGEWWEKIKPMVEVVRVHPYSEMFGVPVQHPAHKADICRLEVLLKLGGVYLDLDVICRRPLLPLMDKRVVVGEERFEGKRVGVCNGIIMARPNENFLHRWLEGFDPHRSLWKGLRSAGPDDRYYTEASVKYGNFLATYWPEEVHVEPANSFFSPTYDEDQLRAFFEQQDSGAFDHAYCHHMWGVAKERYVQGQSLADVASGSSAFAQLVARFI